MKLNFLKPKPKLNPEVKVTLGQNTTHLYLTQGTYFNAGEEKLVELDSEVKELILEGKLVRV